MNINEKITIKENILKSFLLFTLGESLNAKYMQSVARKQLIILLT